MDNQLAELTSVALFDDLPMPLMAYRPDGLLVAVNRAAEQFWGVSREAMVGVFNILQDPQSVEQGSHDLFAQALAGSTIETPSAPYDTSKVDIVSGAGRQLWIQATIFPLHSPSGEVSHVVLMHRDVTARMSQEQAIERAQSEIAAQRETIAVLASPVVEIWEGILTVPLVGTLDAYRAAMVTENLLTAITQHEADAVIVDITGVPLIDTATASYLMMAARAVRLLGSEVALVGVRAEVAQTLVHLGVDFSQLVLRATLHEGLRWAFERRGLRVV
jgi:anti-anti-sigma factor